MSLTLKRRPARGINAAAQPKALAWGPAPNRPHTAGTKSHVCSCPSGDSGACRGGCPSRPLGRCSRRLHAVQPYPDRRRSLVSPELVGRPGAARRRCRFGRARSVKAGPLAAPSVCSDLVWIPLLVDHADRGHRSERVQRSRPPMPPSSRGGQPSAMSFPVAARSVMRLNPPPRRTGVKRLA
jgi:hypothetical protein